MVSFLLLFAGLPVTSAIATNSILIQTPGGLELVDSRPMDFTLAYPSLGHLADVRVGVAPVSVSGIGIFAQIRAAANISWVIFGDANRSAPLLRTAPVHYEANEQAAWLESPEFSAFTLLPGTRYWIGFIVDGPRGAVGFHYNGPGAEDSTQSGITLPAASAADPVGTFLAPQAYLGTSTAQLGIRLRRVGVSLDQPRAGAVYGGALQFFFSLAEDANPGTLRLIFDDGTSSRVLTLAGSQETAGSHSFSAQLANPTLSPAIASGEPIPDGLYTISLSYEGKDGSGVMTSVRPGVRIDSEAPALVVDEGVLNYSENDPPRPIAPTATITDGDFAGGHVLVQIDINPDAADRIAIGPGEGLSVVGTDLLDGSTSFGTVNISGGSVAGSAPLLVSLKQNASDSLVQRLLRSITFANVSENPVGPDRKVTFSVTDAVSLDTAALRTVRVIAVNDPPILAPASGAVIFTEGRNVASTPKVIDPSITVADDGSALAQATIAITNKFRPGEDNLGFVSTSSTMGNITGAYDPALGVLNLSSVGATATIAQWQAALRTITYLNSSEQPSTETRTVTFTVNDGLISSIAVVRTISVIAVNDDPVAMPVSLSTNEDVPLDGVITAQDPEGAPLSYIVVTPPQHGKLVFLNRADFRYTPALDYSGTDFFNFKVNDGTIDSNIARVSINILPVEDPPTLTALPDLVIVEDAGTQLIPLTGITSGAVNEVQVLSVGATVDRPALITDLATYYSSPGSSGVLSFRPVPQANGTAKITVTVRDGSATGIFSREFTVTIRPVNDAPSFEPGGNVSVRQDSDPYNRIWATNIVGGPADEASQPVHFIVVTDRPELFASQPAILSYGVLSFTPARGAVGEAAINVLLADGGGTALGGAGQSNWKTFWISITSFQDEDGTYNGLAQAAPGVPESHANGGLIRMSITGRGAFTSRLVLGGAIYRLHGIIGEDGVAYVKRLPDIPLARAGKSPLILRLQLNFPTQTLVGTISEDGAPFAIIRADRLGFTNILNQTAPPSEDSKPVVGAYTVVFASRSLEGGSGSVLPRGNGIGLLKVTRAGMAILVGSLADGTAVSYANALSFDNAWPFYLRRDKGASSLRGWVHFRDVPDATDLDGPGLNWFKAASPQRALYPGGWSEGIQVDLIGSKYQRPAAFASVSAADSDGNLEIVLEEGGLTPPRLVKQANLLGSKVQVLNSAGDRFKLRLLGKTGLLAGAFIQPVTKAVIPFYGAVLQKQGVGSGYFIGADVSRRSQSGLVSVRPKEHPGE